MAIYIYRFCVFFGAAEAAAAVAARKIFWGGFFEFYFLI